MDWISDMVWLAGEWFLLLALSALVGLAIGWLAWRRTSGEGQSVAYRPDPQATAGRPAGMYLVKDTEESTEETVESDVIDLRALTSERDALRTQRDRLRSQLKEIEAMVGDEESRRQSTDPDQS